MQRALAITGLGVVATGIGSTAELAARVGGKWTQATADVEAEKWAGMDDLSILATKAVWEAWNGAQLMQRGISPERIGLLVLSVFGTVDSAAAYLDSLLEAGGKYTSPRLFTRSLHSSVTSLTAMGLGVKGPCETLAFPQYPVLGMLDRAETLLAALPGPKSVAGSHGGSGGGGRGGGGGRCDAVLVIWADQATEFANDLARRAAEKLHRQEYRQYAAGLGQGAVAMVVEPPQKLEKGGPDQAMLILDEAAGEKVSELQIGVPPYPSDGALRLAAALLRGGGTWTEGTGRITTRRLGIVRAD